MKQRNAYAVAWKILLCCIFVCSLIAVLPKAKAVTYDNQLISIDADNNFTSHEEDVYTVTGSFGGTTCNIYLTNKTEYTLSVKIVCSVSLGSGAVSKSSVKFGSSPLSEGEQTTDAIEVNPGKRITIAVRAGFMGTTTFTLSEIQAVRVTTTQIGFAQGINGTYTVNEVSNLSDYIADSAKRLPVESTKGITVNASSPDSSDYTFFAWALDTDSGISKKIVSYDANTTLTTLDEDGILYPVYAPKDVAMFWVNGCYYETWDEAFSAAGTTYTVALAKSGSLSGGTYQIAQGQKLLIPYDSSYTAHFGNPGLTKQSTNNQMFRRLTLESGANIICNGSICVNAQQYVTSGPTTGYVAGSYGVISLSAGSKIQMESGSALYCYGFVSGQGHVIAKDGSQIHELFQMQDWRGGKVVSSVYKDMTQQSFILSQYYIQNVEANLELDYNSELIGHVGLAAGLGDVKNPFASEVNLIGSAGLFKINAASGNIANGCVKRKYDGSTDRIEYELYGNVDLSSIALQVTGLTDDPISLDSANYVMNIQSNFSITAKPGANLSISSDIKLLPETIFKIEEGAKTTLKSGSELILYDLADWKTGTYTYTGHVYPVHHAYGNTRTTERTLSKDASLIVNGELEIESGAAIYSTKSADTSNAALTGTGTITFKGTSNTDRSVINEINNNNKNDIVSVSVVDVQAPLAGISFAKTDYTHSMSYAAAAETPLTYYANDGYWYNWKVCVANGAGGVTPTNLLGSVTAYQNSPYIVGYVAQGASFGFNLADKVIFLCDGIPYTSTTGNQINAIYGDKTLTRAVAWVSANNTYYTSLNDAKKNYTAGNGYIQMVANDFDGTELVNGTYLDLKGYTVKNVSVNGTLYGMDSTSDGYQGAKGSIAVSGNVEPVTKFEGKNTTEGDYTVSLHRYLAVQGTDNTWSFHRFNISVTDYYLEVLSTGAARIGFGSTFRGDSDVITALTDMGFVINSTKEGDAVLEDAAWAVAQKAISLSDMKNGYDHQNGYKLYYTVDATEMGNNTAIALVKFGESTEWKSDEKTVNFMEKLNAYYNAKETPEDQKVIIDKFKDELSKT